MRYLSMWVSGVASTLLLITTVVLAFQHQQPSAAYWLVVAENSNSTASFDGQQVLDAHFRPHYTQFASGEFIAWSPNPAYYFARLDKALPNQPAGLYRFHVLTGQRTYLIPTANFPQSVEMSLSADQNYFLIEPRDSSPYIMDAEGEYIQTLLEHIQMLAEKVILDGEIQSANWSRDSEWLEFSVRRSIEQVDYYRVRPDGSQLEQNELPIRALTDDRRNLYLSLVDYTLQPIVGDFSYLLEGLPADHIFYIHRWLPNQWLILKADSGDRAPPQPASILYRIRLGGTDFAPIFEDELERSVNVELWDNNGNILYVSAEGDVNSLYEVDMQSGQVRLLLDDYKDLHSNCLVNCLSVHIDDNFHWMLWQVEDEFITYKIQSLKDGAAYTLYQNREAAVREVSFISPDNRWFFVSYVGIQSATQRRHCVTQRISLVNRQVGSPYEGCLLAMSPVIDLPVHLWTILGGAILALITDIAVFSRRTAVAQ